MWLCITGPSICNLSMLLYLQMGALKVSELEKKLVDKGLTLSPLAVSSHFPP